MILGRKRHCALAAKRVREFIVRVIPQTDSVLFICRSNNLKINWKMNMQRRRRQSRLAHKNTHTLLTFSRVTVNEVLNVVFYWACMGRNNWERNTLWRENLEKLLPLAGKAGNVASCDDKNSENSAFWKENWRSFCESALSLRESLVPRHFERER